jgi:hypothetical protein
MFKSFFISAVLTASLLPAAELSPETLEAWQRHVDAADAQMQCRVKPGGTFMWMDEKPGYRLRVTEGEVVVEPTHGHGAIAVRGGLIHDWTGAAFIPNTTLDKFLGVVDDYDRYQDFYRPAVIDSHIITRDGDTDRYSMRLVNKLSLFAYAADTENQVQTFPLDGNRAYVISQSNSIREIRDYGKSSQHELPPDEGDGFIWRLHSISRYEQRDGGVYVELEAIALSRDIPGSLRWIVGPLVAKMSRNSLVISLTQTREALLCNKPSGSTVAARPGAVKAETGSDGNRRVMMTLSH